MLSISSIEMDELIALNQAELRQAKIDYDELFEKFRLANQLFEERDDVYRSKLKELEDTVSLLRRKNDNLKFIIKNQNAAKEAFAEDVNQLQEVARLLEEREKALTDAYESSLRENRHKSMEIEDLKDQINRQEQHYQRLQNFMTETMVPKTEFTAQSRQLQDLETSLQNEFVSKTVHQQALDDLQALKIRVEQDMIDKTLYDALQQKHLELERRLPIDFFPVAEYEKLKRVLQTAMDEKRLIEESSQVVQEQRDQQLSTFRETEARVISLKGRVENQEEEIRDLRSQKEALSEELLTLRSAHLESEDDRRQLRETVRELESAKNHLTTQCSHLKLQLHHEAIAKQEALDAKKQIEKQIDQLRHDYNMRIIDSSQKMNSVFETSEKQYVQRMEEISNHNQRLQLQVQCNLKEIDLLHQENEHLRTHCRDLETLIGDAKTQLTLQLASQESCIRENELFKQQEQVWRSEKEQLFKRMQDLQQENQQMQDYLEEFRLLVFSELSPTFRKFLVKGDEGENGHDLLPSSTHAHEVQNLLFASPHTNAPRHSGTPGESATSPYHHQQQHSSANQPPVSSSKKTPFQEKMQQFLSPQHPKHTQFMQQYQQQHQQPPLESHPSFISDLSMPAVTTPHMTTTHASPATAAMPNYAATNGHRARPTHKSPQQLQQQVPHPPPTSSPSPAAVAVAAGRVQEAPRQPRSFFAEEERVVYGRHYEDNDEEGDGSTFDDDEEEEEVVVIVPRDPNDRSSPPKPAMTTTTSPSYHRMNSNKSNHHLQLQQQQQQQQQSLSMKKSGSALLRVSQTPIAAPGTPTSLPAPPVQQPSPRSLLAHKTITPSPVSPSKPNQDDTLAKDTVPTTTTTPKGTLHPKTVMQNSARLLRKLITSPSADNVVPRSASGRNLLQQQVAAPSAAVVGGGDTPSVGATQQRTGAPSLLQIDTDDKEGETRVSSAETTSPATKGVSAAGEINFSKPSLNSPRSRAMAKTLVTPSSTAAGGVVPYVMVKSPLPSVGVSPAALLGSGESALPLDDSLIMSDHDVIQSYKQAIR